MLLKIGFFGFCFFEQGARRGAQGFKQTRPRAEISLQKGDGAVAAQIFFAARASFAGFDRGMIVAKVIHTV
jgi:hypothetical protein